MSSSFVQLASDLIRSGLISAEELQNVTATLEGAGGAASEQALISRLQEAGTLTPYQVVALLAGKIDELTFGNYVVLDKIGEGGMGAVYRARHRRMKRIVAIKVLPRQRINSPERLQRFQREIETVAQLSHPNIVTAYDADECPLGPYLVMEYVAGSDLALLVESGGPLEIQYAVDYVTQAARALEYAHSQNIVHRDVKPANMLRDAKGTVKVTDLGLAQFISTSEDELHGGQQAARRGAISGTIDYMAPEQLQPTPDFDHRADIYSLGCSLYFLLTGKVMVGGATIMQKLLAHRERTERSLREFRQDVPADLDLVFQRMTAKKPSDRFSSMTEVIEALEGCVLPTPVVGGGEAEPNVHAVKSSQPTWVEKSAPTSWVEGSSLSMTDVSLLLVEPSRLQSHVITTQLENLGIRRIQIAVTGQAALETMLATPPELVVSSMHLPDMTGAELVQSMRGHASLKDKAFVLISSETDYDLLEPVRQAGTAAILPKPFGLEALRKALAVAIDFLSPDAVRVHNLQVAELRVLIADDSTSARRHVRRVLENLGVATIVEAPDGRQAIELLRQNPCDLVVSDYNMPEVDGPALVRHLRQDPQFQHLPILMITSETDPARLAAAREAGVSALCSKVFDPQTVCGILSTILVRHRPAN